MLILEACEETTSSGQSAHQMHSHVDVQQLLIHYPKTRGTNRGVLSPIHKSDHHTPKTENEEKFTLKLLKSNIKG